MAQELKTRNEMDKKYQWRLEDIFATEEAYERNRRMLGSVPVTLVTVAEMERISTLATPPELMAVARQASQTLIGCRLPRSPAPHRAAAG